MAFPYIVEITRSITKTICSLLRIVCNHLEFYLVMSDTSALPVNTQQAHDVEMTY